jgi:phenylalanyl-tRNA synthetase beta chain
MLLDDVITPAVGEKLVDALGLEQDVVFDISIEGNRPDAWSIIGIARDIATRLGRELREPVLESPNTDTLTSSVASVGIDDPTLCGRLTLSYFRNIKVGPSPSWIAQRIQAAGMRSISNVVDASNLVMLELGQPNHPYDAATVAKKTVRARRARSGEVITTLDGVARELAKPGRGLGDTGEDCVIVDGDDNLLGLAGIMGGASSEISDSTTEVLFEAAFFDPMTIARSSKRHALRSEASNRFERGVDPSMSLRAAGRFVAILRESCPDLEWYAEPLDARGDVPALPEINLRNGDVERALGVEIDNETVTRILSGLGFSVASEGTGLLVTPPSARLDIRHGDAGRADVIEEIARLYSYARLPRRTPTWPAPGGLNARQQFRRRLRDVVVDLGAYESWTPTLGSDVDADVLSPNQPRVRITNPLASEESVLRSTLITGLLQAWAKNHERGDANVILSELGTIFHHPETVATPRATRGGAGGTVTLALPLENERMTILLGREGDDAKSAVATLMTLANRLGLADLVIRPVTETPAGLHPSRCGIIVDRATGTHVGVVGEIDPQIVASTLSLATPRRVGVIDLDVDVLSDATKVTRQPVFVSVPSKYPSASIDLAFVTPRTVHAQDLAHALSQIELVESATLFDVYEGESLPQGTRSLAYAIVLSATAETLSEKQIASTREALVSLGISLGATLR